MKKYSDENSFQIILQSNDGDNLSKDWQDQCNQFYDDLLAIVPEESVKPLIFESTPEKKGFDIASFSNIIITDIAAEFVTSLFIKGILEAYNSWSKYRKSDYIIIKYPDKSFIKISEPFLEAVLKFK